MKKKREVSFPYGDEMKLQFRKMKLTALLLFIVCVTFGNSFSQIHLTVRFDKTDIREVLQTIEEKTDYIFLYKDRIFDFSQKINADFTDAKFEEVLKSFCEQTNTMYEIRDRQIILKEKASSLSVEQQPQKKSISGKVTDTNGATLPGVTVVLKGTTTGTITDASGNYSLPNVPENATVQFSFVGMKTQELTVGNKTTMNVTLVEDAIGIEEVVAIGYGSVKKSDLTGSVTSLNSDAISLGYSQSPDLALKGKTAGVQITTVSGQPGAGAVVRIRGTNSIVGSNEPLYVVDGVPLDGGGAADGIQGVSSSPLTIISPSDIESMEVLKDASSTAIYGSRGANGVILITTKRGKEGAYNANFNISKGFQNVSHRLELTTPEQWAELWNESMDYKNGGVGKYDISNLPARTNWQDEIFQTAPIQNYELSFSGGNEKLHYMLSGGYTSQDGIIMNTDFKRYSIRANLENKFTKWLTVGVNLSATRTDSNQAQDAEGTVSADNPVGLILTASPVVPIYNMDGSYVQYVDVESKRENPYASLKEITNNDIRNRFVSNIYTEISFLKELKLRSNFAADVVDARGKYYAPSYIAQGRAANGSASIGSNNKIYWNLTNALTYSKIFRDIHRLTAMVGVEWQKDVVEKYLASGTEFANDNARFDNLGEATNYGASSGYAAWQMQSYITRFTYSLMNRYLFTFTGRRDGSSRFAKGNKNAFFPSGAFGWRLNEEDFLKDVRSISNLKFRASYGISGEQGIPLYQTFSTLSASKVFVGTELNTGYIPTRAADPSLRWEKTQQVDVGLDVGLWGGRLNASVDYYHKRTNDLLYQKALPASSGFTARLGNIGSIENKGLEVMLDAFIVDNKKFKWDLKVNNAFNRNKLINLGDGRKEIINPSGGVSGGDLKSTPSILRVGEPLGLIYGYQSDGVIYDQAESDIAKQMGQIQYAPGELKIRDLNGDGKISDQDKTIIGDANPKFTGGITNTFTYKGFQLNLLCQWVVGNDIMSYQHMANQRLSLGYNATKEWYDTRWQVNNPSRVEPRAGYDIRAYPDVSYNIYDGSYFRINNVSLSYELPKHLISRIKLNNLKFSVGIDNLYTFTKYPGWSPDVSSMGDNVMGQGIDVASYPVPRTTTFGINIGF